MADENKLPVNKLNKFDQAITTTKNVKDLFVIEDVRERYIKNFEAVTGRKDGANRLEQEKYAYLDILHDKPDLKSAPMWAHFSALLKSATTGLSFRDGKLYVQPVKNRDGVMVNLKVDPSPAGRREMMEMMPTIKEVPEAQVVYVGDLFTEDKLNHKILKHETTEKSKSKEDLLENVVCSYQRVIFADGSIKDVVVPHADLVKAKNKSKVKNPDTDGVWLFNAEACKKTATKRAFRLYHKYPDGVVIYANDERDEDDDDNSNSTSSYPDPADVDTTHEVVDKESGEVTTVTAEEVKEQPKRERREPPQFN